MHAYKKKDANPQKGIDSQGISIEKTGYCRGNFSLVPGQIGLADLWREASWAWFYRGLMIRAS
jgi:hypothetical protein